jgi:exopolyphosphatase / guanosine-5'-triphosphate,3'-diphosphate pyrophosphatase
MTTEAVRCATNGKDCIKELNNNCGVEFEIITGEQEAILTEKALNPLTSQFPNRVICDIGGGSTELIFIEENKTQGYHSIPLGVVRIEKTFKVTSNLNNHNSAIFEIKKLLGSQTRNTNALILCGGTATTTASILLGLKGYDAKKVEGYVLKKEELEALILKASKMDLNDLHELLVTDKERADVITAGFLIIRESINHFNPTTVMISTYGPRHGFVMEKLGIDEVIQ